MPRLTKRTPAYRKHPNGTAIVSLGGQVFSLGHYGSKASREKYHRLIAEWESNGRRITGSAAGADAGLTINELFVQYLRYARGYYVKDGRTTQQMHRIEAVVRKAKPLYGHSLAAEFGPIAFKAVRKAMVDHGYARTNINACMGCLRRVFKWGGENELVPASVFQSLGTVAGLRKGRTDAKESKPVRPIAPACVEAVLPHVSAQVAAMIHLQELSGMRPGEVCIMRGADLETAGKVWYYRPESHKTEHHGKQRIVALGPQAQAVLKPFLKADLAAYLFSPEEAELTRNAEKKRNRKTPMTPSHRRRAARARRAQWADHYDVAAYRHAIARGCDKAGVPRWHPNQLRHSAATRIRREFGIEVARAVLGHSSAVTTEIYAEADADMAAKVMEKLG